MLICPIIDEKAPKNISVLPTLLMSHFKEFVLYLKHFTQFLFNGGGGVN